MGKLTTEQFVCKATRRHGDRYDYSKSVYTGAHKKLTITCRAHGDFLQLAGDHANVGKGCPKCGVIAATPQSFTTAEFVARARARHGDRYDYSESCYTNTKRKLRIICKRHGPFEQTAGKHLRGSGCPLCRDGGIARTGNAVSIDERCARWKGAANSLHGGRYDYSKVVFKNSKTPVEIICREHGSFYQTPGNHLHGGCQCPACAEEGKRIHTRNSTDAWLRSFRRAHTSGRYDYSRVGHVVDCRQRVTIVCAKHGHFSQQAYVHALGHGCPRCVNKVSRPEDDLAVFLASLCPDEPLVRSTRKVIAPYELDVFFPRLNVAVEFNGTYWHHDGVKQKNYHQRKSLLCRARGVRLFHIYDYDWMTRRAACERLLRDKLRGPRAVYDARKLSLKPAIDLYREFLDANHWQGGLASQAVYGLFDGDALLSVMTFGPSRFDKAKTWEMLRFCSLAGTRVRGAAGKLFKAFARDHLTPGDTVVSYARLDYSNGDVYTRLGFVEEGVCPPDYVWVSHTGWTVLRRQSTQKHKLPRLLGSKFDPTLSEAENMRKSNYRRVYSAGNLKYTYTHE
jgi:phage FluMu protein Com